MGAIQKHAEVPSGTSALKTGKHFGGGGLVMCVRMETSWEEQNHRAFDHSGSTGVKQIEGRGARKSSVSPGLPQGRLRSLGAKEESTEMAG